MTLGVGEAVDEVLVEPIEGLGLVDAVEVPVSDDDVVGLAEAVSVEEVVPDADELAVEDPDVLDVVDVLAPLALLTAAAMTTLSFGMVAHTLLAVIPSVVLGVGVLAAGAMVTSIPSAWLSVPNPRNANTVSAPSAAGLTISALTRATSFRQSPWQDRPCYTDS